MNKGILAIIAILLVSACVAQGKGPAEDGYATIGMARPVFDSGKAPSTIDDAKQIVMTNFDSIMSKTVLYERGYRFFPKYANGEAFADGDWNGGAPVGNTSLIKFIVGVPFAGIAETFKEENNTIYRMNCADTGLPADTNGTSSQCQNIKYSEPSYHYLLIDSNGVVLSIGANNP